MKINCQHCDVQFERAACFVRRVKRTFCSPECRQAADRRRVTESCVACGTSFEVELYRHGKRKRSFCSVACRRFGKMERCATCAKRFYRSPSHARAKRLYCSTACASEQTRFQPGSVPWNRGLKGIHLSPATEFQIGRTSDNALPIGSVTIRRRQRDKKPRAWVKVAQPNKWILRALLVWMTANGDIPSGYVVHHGDRDTLNDAIENLALLTRADHLNEHRHEFRKKSSP